MPRARLPLMVFCFQCPEPAPRPRGAGTPSALSAAAIVNGECPAAKSRKIRRITAASCGTISSAPVIGVPLASTGTR